MWYQIRKPIEPAGFVRIHFVSNNLKSSAAARELLRARIAHPAAGQYQAAGEGLGAVELLRIE